MPEEEKKGDEGDQEKGHPETVPWSQHVAAKETISNKLKAAEEKVSSLEEQLKNAPNKEEHDRLVQELADKSAQLEKEQTEHNQEKEKTANELREALKGTKVFSDEELSSMSEAELRAAVKAAGSKSKSLPDLGGGGGSGGELKGSPMQLARNAYEQSSEK